MTTDDPATDRTGREDFPDWLRQLERDIRPGLAVRLRIWCRRRSRRLVGGVGVLLVLALLAGAAAYRSGHLRRPGPAAHPAAGPGATASPTAVPGPFAGTPAAGWPAGPAGIVLPPAHRAGDFTTAQVAAGLAQVRATLLTARLDRPFMAGRSPDPLLRHFAPAARASVRKDWTTETIAAYATRLAPDARLAPDPPRVSGRITYQATRATNGVRELAVTTNFVWVYGFRDPGARSGYSVVLLHDTVVWHLPHQDDVAVASRGLWLHQMSSYGWGLDCGAIHQGLVRPGGLDPAAAPFPEDPESLYDPDHPIALPTHC
ncbi:hypothetical protein [Micromonospora chersina]|uniref:hypothetical protein n=1 Tax=Micromonospora chersina TaxID=47854 RepID=UPI0033D725EC